jgi:hypothetical protein
LLFVALFTSLCFNSIAAEKKKADLDTVSEKCGVVAKDKDGKETAMLLPSLKVLTLTAREDDFVLPKDAPSNVAAVQCGRESLIPAQNDYKVLKAGFPFFIVSSDGRIAVMELSEGKLEYRTIDGEFAEEEISLIQSFLNNTQSYFDSPPSKASNDN